ncbi:hypothetical protein KHP62_06730 [Rhodobacteraceae bacterium NNCM2]|nr:hypothetical protein [Coraliihabitans acroporae]
MNRKPLILALAFVLVPFTASAITIDSFETSQGPVNVAAPGSTSDVVSGAGIIGGERDLFIENIDTNPPAGNGGLTTVTANGAFTISDADTVASNVLLTYDGPGSTGLGPADLLVDGSTLFSIGINSLDLVLDLTVEVFSTTGASSLTQQISGFIPSSAPIVPFEFFFNDFVPVSGSGADFGAVERLTFGFSDALESYDLNIEFIETRVTGVPVPPSLLLMLSALLGIGGLAYARRKA